MDINCSSDELLVLEKISKSARSLNMESYVIGGFVRDKLLDRPTKDMDIVCIGDGIELAALVGKQFKPHPQVSFFKTFGTA